MKKTLGLIVAIIAIAVASAQLETLPDWAQGLQTSEPFLVQTFLKVHVWQWMGLGVLALVAFLMGLVMRWVTLRLTRIRDHFAPVHMAEGTRLSIGRSAGLVLGTLFAELLLNDLTLRNAFQEDLEILLNSIALFGSVLFLYAWWDAACETLAYRATGHERAERLLIPMTRKLVRATIVVGGLLAGIALFGGTRAIATMVGTLGITGLVVALAAKDSVENLFGSFTIMFDMPFALGDWVKIDKVEGTVEQINLRSTRLRTAEDTVIHLPNANLIRASVENFGSRRFRRLKLTLRLSYDCEPKNIDAYVLDLLEFMAKQKEISDGKSEVVLTDPQELSIGLLIDCRLEVDTYSEEIRARHRILDETLRLREPHQIVFAAAPRPKDVSDEVVRVQPGAISSPTS
jgi:MscS family membrane protein